MLDLTKREAVLALGALALTACGTTAAPPESSRQAERKRQVVALLKGLETREPAALAVIHPQRYTQHNLAVPDGPEGLKGLLRALPGDAIKVQTVRVFADGDFVFAHTAYDFFGPKIGFDVFRFDGDRVVEHWDNLQPTPAQPNPSGRTMIDGPTAAIDLDRTAANKATVAAFVDDVLVRGRLEHLERYFAGDDYRQHNPQIGDTPSGLRAALDGLAQRGTALKYDRVHWVLGEGSFVLALSEGRLGDARLAFYDLFRVQGGKLAEHWDVVEAIPPRGQWKNDNGKF